MTDQPKFIPADYDRPKCRVWNIIADGVEFAAMAERGYRNRRPGHGEGMTLWTIFVWKKNSDGTQKSIAVPHDVYSAPRKAIAKIVSDFVASVTARNPK